MSDNKKWQVGLLAGALTLGLAWCGTSAANAPENAQEAGAQQDGNQQSRRGRGQGRGAGGPAAARNPTEVVEQMKTQVMELKLTDEQKPKLEAIFKESSEQAKTLATEVEGLQGRERNQKMMGFRRDMREKVNAALTEEQRQTLRRNQATQDAKQMTDRYRRTLGELNLSDDQKTKVEAVLADGEKKMADAAAQGGPAEGGTAGPGGRRGGGGLTREIANDTRGKIVEILTPEQKTKFEEAMPQGRGQGGGGGGRRGGQQQN